MKHNILRNKAAEIWGKYRNGGRPSEDEQKILIDAYWEGCLPKDPHYSVAQWIEDRFPSL